MENYLTDEQSIAFGKRMGELNGELRIINDKSKIIIILNSIIHDIIPIDGLYKDRHPITLEKLDIE